MSTSNGVGILETALVNVIRARSSSGAYGSLIEGIPSVSIVELVTELGGIESVFVSVVGLELEEALLTWARNAGWPESRFGVGATHAVCVRNEAPSGATKLVFVFNEEERLHSLRRRNYGSIGPQEVTEEISRLGAAGAANVPERNLWLALGSPELSPFISLEGIINYYASLSSASEVDRQNLPRQLLPVLGFLPDPELLAGNYASAKNIVKRLDTNGATVRQIRRADEDDRQKAVSAVKASESDERLELLEGYNAFLRIARNELDALGDLPLPLAERLLSGKKSKRKETSTDDTPNEVEPDEVDAGDSDAVDEPEERGEQRPRRRIFPSLDEAAVQLFLEGDQELLARLVEKASSVLDQDEIQSDSIDEGNVSAKFAPDPRVVALARATTSVDRLGGRLDAQGQLLDAVLKDLSRYVNRIQTFADVRLATLLDLLRRAGDILPDFEGEALLHAYLARRSALMPFKDLLVVSPLACLLVHAEARTAATQAIAEYQRLVSHLDEMFSALRRLSQEGATVIYNEILSLDLIRIDAQDELGALISTVNPLVLWKYTQLADLVQTREAELSSSERSLLADEIVHLPEPLLAIYAPGERVGESMELGFAGILGSFPLYRPTSVQSADLREASLSLAGAKLLALYPPVRQNLRILLVDPLTTEHASRAVKKLVQKNELRRATLIIARTQRTGDEGIFPPDRTLDELSAGDLITVEEQSFASYDRLAAHLASKPVHLLAIAGEHRKNVELIESQGTRLHPLSLPHRLHADPLLGTVSLQPRSLQPAEGSPGHPFGVYQSLIANLSGNPHSEYSLRETQQGLANAAGSLEPFSQFILMTGDLPQTSANSDLLRLTQGITLRGDAVYTHHKNRILRGMDTLLRQMHYRPSSLGLEILLHRLQEVGGEGIFATISPKAANGFSETALRGQLGLAVALNWYRGQTEGDRNVVLSLDSYLAARWLQKREDAKRTDLLGISQGGDGSVSIDVIEVKSYESTDQDDLSESYASGQLRSVAGVLLDMLQNQGDILIDRRRELLRLQVFREGLANRAVPEADWVEALNDTLDGNREVSVNLILIELAFEQNLPLEDRLFYPTNGGQTAVDMLPVRRLRLGEADIQPHLHGIVERLQGSPDDEDDVVVIEPVEMPQPVESRDHTEPDIGPGESPETGSVEGDSIQGDRSPTLGFEPTELERDEIAKVARQIYRVLRDLGVNVMGEVDPDQADVGPSVVRYKVRLQTGERVSALQSRARDLMRELATAKEPIIDNLPGTSFVSIDLPRPSPRPAYLLGFLDQAEPPTQEHGLWCPVGITPDGNAEWLDLTALPHMLVAGATGMGKTMFLYSLTMSLMHYYTPTDLQLVLIDPKQTDFVFFRDVAHLRGNPIITEPREAIAVLMHLLTDELTKRTETLTQSMARDIRSYNARFPDQPINPIVVVIDEFADMADVMTRSERTGFDHALRRLAQRARNVGIHLVLATQRPTADIVNGTLKTNLPCRISFRLASQVDSRTILDQSGAEHLLGNGDMLVSWNGRIQRLQGFFVPEEQMIHALELGQA